MNLLRLQKDFCAMTESALTDPWYYLTIPSEKIQLLRSHLSPAEIIRLLALWAYGGSEGPRTEKIDYILNLNEKSANKLVGKFLAEEFLILEREHLKPPFWYSYKTKTGEERRDLKYITKSSFPIRLHADQLKLIIAENNKHEYVIDKIGKCFGLLPYINVKYSILCENPAEQNLEKIVPLSQKKLATALGLSEMSASRMYQLIKEPVTVNGRAFYIFGQAKLENGRIVHLPNARLFYTRETDPLLFSWDFSEINTIKNWDID